MDVSDSRYAGAEIEKLVYTLIGEKPDDPTQESPVSLHEQRHIGQRFGNFLRRRTVNVEVVEAAQQVVVYTGRARSFGVGFSKIILGLAHGEVTLLSQSSNNGNRLLE